MSPTGDEIAQQDLPGIGRRYDLRDADGHPVTVIVHNTGRRDLYHRADGDGDGDMDLVFALTDDQARRMGAILSGAFFKPAVVTEIEAVIGGLLIDWVTLRPDSPGAGRSIAQLEIRRRTRMTVAAIQRQGETVIAPEPDEVLQAGDRLVVMGRQEDLLGFVQTIVG